MNQALISVVVFVGLLAMVPLAVKWLAQRRQLTSGTPLATSKLVSVLAVGPQQRVVTVEVGPPEARVWLVLGVTAQSINTLHTLHAAPAAPAFAAVLADTHGQ
jgi:flagellar protein FliO/FliZ